MVFVVRGADGTSCFIKHALLRAAYVDAWAHTSTAATIALLGPFPLEVAAGLRARAALFETPGSIVHDFAHDCDALRTEHAVVCFVPIHCSRAHQKRSKLRRTASIANFVVAFRMR